MRYNSDGPAVMLCEPTSVFPAHLAAYWRAKGMEVVLVTHRHDAQPSLPDGTPIVRVDATVVDRHVGFGFYAGPKERNVLAQAHHDLDRALVFVGHG